MSCLVPGIYDSDTIRQGIPVALYDAYTMVIGSPYITANPLYSRFGDIDVSVANRDDINAYAGIDTDNGTEIPRIVVFSGILGWLRASSIVAAAMYTGDKPTKLRKMLVFLASQRDNAVADPASVMNSLCAAFKLRCDGSFSELADRMFRMMLAALLAHETGHLCLGHYYCGSGAESGGTSRNDERNADIFACSILQSMGTGDCGAAGMIAMLVSLMFSANGRETYDGLGTHPATVERIRNVYSSFYSILQYSKITWYTIERIICK